MKKWIGVFLVFLIMVPSMVACKPKENKMGGELNTMGVNHFDLQQVQLSASTFQEKEALNYAYINQLDVDKLLFAFYQNKG